MKESMSQINYFLLGLTALQVLLAGCSRKEDAESVIQSPIRVEPAEVRLGAFELLAPQKRKVILTATSADGNAHRITSIQVSCSCIQFDESVLKKRVGSTESVEIPVEISLTSQSGVFRQAIRIIVDENEEHPIVVEVSAYLNTPPRSSIKELVFRKDQVSQEARASILFTTYKPAAEPELSVKSVSGIPGISVINSIVERNGSPDEAASVLERLQVELQLAGSHDIGESSLGTIEFGWMDDVIPKVSIPVHLIVVPAVQITPSTVYLGALSVDESARGRFTLKSEAHDKLTEIVPAFETSEAFADGSIHEVESGNSSRSFEFQLTPRRQGRLDGSIIIKGKDGTAIDSVKFWALVRKQVSIKD